MLQVASTDYRALHPYCRLKGGLIKLSIRALGMATGTSLTESTGIRTHHRNLEELELQYPLNVVVQV
jgi:hypothetical protein